MEYPFAWNAFDFHPEGGSILRPCQVSHRRWGSGKTEEMKACCDDSVANRNNFSIHLEINTIGFPFHSL